MRETQETWVQSLGQEDSLEEEMATHSSILCRENPMDKEAWWATVHSVSKESDTTEQLSIQACRDIFVCHTLRGHGSAAGIQ